MFWVSLCLWSLWAFWSKVRVSDSPSSYWLSPQDQKRMKMKMKDVMVLLLSEELVISHIDCYVFLTWDVVFSCGGCMVQGVYTNAMQERCEIHPAECFAEASLGALVCWWFGSCLCPRQSLGILVWTRTPPLGEEWVRYELLLSYFCSS